VREAIEAGGVKLDPKTRPMSAKDYGPYLKDNGFSQLEMKEGETCTAQKGDVAVSMAAKKWAILAAKWHPPGAFLIEPFPLVRSVFLQERPGAVKGAP
jgi:hypothetical protein